MEDQFNKDAGRSSVSGPGSGTAARMKEEVSDKIATAKEKVSDFGRQTANAIDAQRAPVASTLDKTASALHQTADQVGTAGHVAGDKVQDTADYLRQTDVKGMLNDIQNVVKRYPVQSLAAAAVLGFLLARGWGRSD